MSVPRQALLCCASLLFGVDSLSDVASLSPGWTPDPLRGHQPWPSADQAGTAGLPLRPPKHLPTPLHFAAASYGAAIPFGAPCWPPGLRLPRSPCSAPLAPVGFDPQTLGCSLWMRARHRKTGHSQIHESSLEALEASHSIRHPLASRQDPLPCLELSTLVSGGV
eukprot:scaffold433_cov257-Pinguiococcus_pyrenoidosus.AAC.22